MLNMPRRCRNTGISAGARDEAKQYRQLPNQAQTECGKLGGVKIYSILSWITTTRLESIAIIKRLLAEALRKINVRPF